MALAQLTVLHAALSTASDGHGRRWALVSWALAATHLGLLESRRSLSAADLLTLLRANLPATGTASRPSVAALALATDVIDGRLARRQGTVTPFGAYSDAMILLAARGVWRESRGSR